MSSLQKTRENNLPHTQRSLEKTILRPYIRREHVFPRRDDPVQVHSSFSSILEFSLRTLCDMMMMMMMLMMMMMMSVIVKGLNPGLISK